MRCANDHPAIEHDEFYCPLCVELAERFDESERIYQLEAHVEDLITTIDELELADVLHLQAQLNDAQKEAYEANLQVKRLLYAIEYTKPTPLGRYQSQVKQAATQTRLDNLKRTA